MNDKMFFSSLTRIGPFRSGPLDIRRRPHSDWATGDYVVIELLEAARAQPVELADGRLAEAYPGARIVGALGERAATLESVGSWRAVDGDAVNMMTAAGLVGLITSRSTLMPPLVPARYLGHAVMGDRWLAMRDMVASPVGSQFDIPVVLIIGTSMSSGKTITGRVIVRLLKERGLKVVGAKLTGAGRYRDVLSLADAGADAVFDFVDGGLPSSVCDPDEYRRALAVVLDLIKAERPDVVVAEAGASPLEPYNGLTAMELLGDAVTFIVLAASDPYAVAGVISAFGLRPNVVTGVATSTSAGIDLIGKLTGIRAINVLKSEHHRDLDVLLTVHNRLRSDG